MAMNKESNAGNWNILKGKMKQTWAKLTDDDFKRAEGNFQELAGRIQEVYGYTKEKAWQEVEKFQGKFANATQDIKDRGADEHAQDRDWSKPADKH